MAKCRPTITVKSAWTVIVGRHLAQSLADGQMSVDIWPKVWLTAKCRSTSGPKSG